MNLQCCVCKKVQTLNGWAAVEDGPAGRICHTYCEPCWEVTRKQLQEEARRLGLAHPGVATPPGR